MKFLLFLLGIVFFFIFYIFFSQLDVNGYFISNLFWIANIYVFLALLFVGYLFSISLKLNKKDSLWDIDEEKQKWTPSLEDVTSFVGRLFSEYIYYIACALFYIALYFIIHSFYGELNIPLLFMILNGVVIVLYFLEHKFEVFQDLVRVNMILISLYYIIVHTLYIFWFSYLFSLIDMINIAAVFILLFILLSTKKENKYFELLWNYFIAFSFLEMIVLSKSLFWWGSFSFALLAGSLWVGSLIFTKQVHTRLTFTKKMIRAWGVFFLSVFIILSAFHIGEENIYTLILIPLLVLWGWILYKFHEQFQNYGALAMGSLAYLWSIYGIYGILFPEAFENKYFYVLALLISWGCLFFERIYIKPKRYDIYFFHILSLLVNLVWIFCFLFFMDVSILSVWLLLLIESIYLFVSYYTISNTDAAW